ncbi:MAG: DUF3820 family protein [Parachlamydiales bacterium]|nr:DUF3820 family protein [Parachlamydiales bacterium]
MGSLHKDIFACIDIESTGLDIQYDRIIEIAICTFDFDHIISSYSTLVDPERDIPSESEAIHHISLKMVLGKPKIFEVLPKIFSHLDHHVLIGHGIWFDIAMMKEAAKRSHLETPFDSIQTIDTLRLARLYGQSPVNSLETLRKHFNIPEEGAHRALNDVYVNIDVFKHLSKSFTTTEEIIERLKKPILLRKMPLGKHKGRLFPQIPIDYLKWASHQDFDADLLYSVRHELKKRKISFEQATNPFTNLE